MRGYIGAGTNRINIYVVRQATEGLAKLVESKGETAKKLGLLLPMTHDIFTRIRFRICPSISGPWH